MVIKFMNFFLERTYRMEMTNSVDISLKMVVHHKNLNN